MEARSDHIVVLKYAFWGLALGLLSTWRISDAILMKDDFQKRATVPLPGKLVQDSREHRSYRFSFVPPSRSPHQRSDSTMLKTFELAIGENWKSTVQIMSGRHQVALGVVVDPKGWIVTKASQVVGGNLECRLHNGTQLPTDVIRVNDELDLALLKVDRDDLVAVEWSLSHAVPVGSWLATTTTNRTPIGIGVCSVGPRSIPKSKAVLGVQLGEGENGALVSMVVPGGGAERAGIERGDIIVSIDNTPVPDREAVLRKIAELKAGQRVSVVVQREENSLTIQAQLMDLSSNLFDPTEMEVNGNVSARATGFTRVFQHDTVLAPHQCGGPLIDSHGRVVGINIARAGRVNSYALPLDVAVPAIRDLLVNAQSVHATPVNVRKD